MKIGDLVLNLNNQCKYCGHNFYLVKYVKPHVGLYCHNCLKWHKWMSKQEKEMYNIITPDDLKNELNEKSTKVVILDDIGKSELDKRRKDYEEYLDDEVPF